MSDEGETIFGKRILVGLTYVDESNKITKRVQLYGEVTGLSENTLFFERADGQGEFSIPFDGELELAEEDAVYTLNSTGEEVTDVQFLSSLVIHPPGDD